MFGIVVDVYQMSLKEGEGASSDSHASGTTAHLQSLIHLSSSDTIFLKCNCVVVFRSYSEHYSSCVFYLVSVLLCCL
jgi:hypothetical protein